MITFLTSFVLAAHPIDSEMTVKQKKRTGVAKLNEKQKAALQQWIDSKYVAKGGKSDTAAKVVAPTLQDNLYNGHYIRLTDGSLWEINPEDTPITQGWITPVEIIVSESGNTDYPYKLTNSLTGSSVRAKKAQSLKK